MIKYTISKNRLKFLITYKDLKIEKIVEHDVRDNKDGVKINDKDFENT